MKNWYAAWLDYEPVPSTDDHQSHQQQQHDKVGVKQSITHNHIRGKDNKHRTTPTTTTTRRQPQRPRHLQQNTNTSSSSSSSPFPVKTKHIKLPNESGVTFNIETTPPATQADKHKPRLTREQITSQIKQNASHFHHRQHSPSSRRRPDVSILVTSHLPPSLISTSPGSGFLTAVLTAYAHHLPLTITPDHVWLLLSHAAATHIFKNAEAVRPQVVPHDGTKRFVVAADCLSLDDCDDPTSWEATIISTLSTHVRRHLGRRHRHLSPPSFTTSDGTSRAVGDVTLLHSTSPYASDGMTTGCGIPRVTLLGSEEDWIVLKESVVERWGEVLGREFGERWIPSVKGVLEEFVGATRGEVRGEFWQGMVVVGGGGGRKERGGRRRTCVAGKDLVIDGWMQILFPYLRDGRLNEWGMRPWKELLSWNDDNNQSARRRRGGVRVEDIPAVLSSVPIDWDYQGRVHNLHFHAGFVGCAQGAAAVAGSNDDEDDEDNNNEGNLTPVLGWYVTHDPSSSDDQQLLPDVRLEAIQNEIDDLLEGHADEILSTTTTTTTTTTTSSATMAGGKKGIVVVLNKESPWYRRVNHLHAEQLKIAGAARRAPLRRKIQNNYNNDTANGSASSSMPSSSSSSSSSRWKKIWEMTDNLYGVTTDDMIKDYFNKKMKGHRI